MPAGYFTLRSLLVLCPSYLIYMALIGGLAIPGGLFMPAIMVCTRLSLLFFGHTPGIRCKAGRVGSMMKIANQDAFVQGYMHPCRV